jgi:hypothetical protein
VANTGSSHQEVKAICDKLEISPSENAPSSPVKGGGSKASAGEKESGFKGAKGAKPSGTSNPHGGGGY